MIANCYICGESSRCRLLFGDSRHFSICQYCIDLLLPVEICREIGHIWDTATVIGFNPDDGIVKSVEYITGCLRCGAVKTDDN